MYSTICPTLAAFGPIQPIFIANIYSRITCQLTIFSYLIYDIKIPCSLSNWPEPRIPSEGMVCFCTNLHWERHQWPY